MTVYLYDCNNYVRVKSETSFSGSFVRDLITEANTGNDLKFYIFDGKNCNDYRRSFYPQYKMTRKAPIDNFFENLKWFHELLMFAKPNVGVVQVDGYEADDVIAHMAKMFDEVVVMSTDKDLLQIPNSKQPMANNEWESRDLIFTRKVLVGDPSDNISGIKGFGDTSWKSLVDDDKYSLKKWIEDGDEGALDRVLYSPLSTLSNRAKNVLKETSREEIETLKKVIGFREVSDELISIHFGEDKLDEIERQLGECFL